ncbi:hypothetical protein [Aquisalimonas sp.]|uniref:hypothetical protein n=1 Tax=Aquisalimonas sp. TaxID=1872621 RepID=UPI0025C636B7|nr:hypothetical protein [Aquisalimonas sp.]
MSKLPDVSKSKAPEPVRQQWPLAPWFPPMAGLSLTISRTEVSLQDGEAHVRAERHYLEEGRVVTERVEGQVPTEVYHEAARAAEEHMRSVMELMQQQMKLFTSLWLPGPPR